MRTQSYVERTYPRVWESLRLQAAKEWSDSDAWYGRWWVFNVVMLANAAVVVSQLVLEQYAPDAYYAAESLGESTSVTRVGPHGTHRTPYASR